jgi:hypothetical protein
VLLLDDAGRVLLFRGGDPAAPERGTWWITPGGGDMRRLITWLTPSGAYT